MFILEEKDYEFLMESIHDLLVGSDYITESGVWRETSSIEDVKEWANDPVHVRGLTEFIMLEEEALKADDDWDYEEERYNRAAQINSIAQNYIGEQQDGISITHEAAFDNTPMTRTLPKHESVILGNGAIHSGIFWLLTEREDLLGCELAVFSYPSDGNDLPTAPNTLTFDEQNIITHNYEHVWETMAQTNEKYSPSSNNNFNYYPRGCVQIDNRVATIILPESIDHPAVIKEIREAFNLRDENLDAVRVIVDSSPLYQGWTDRATTQSNELITEMAKVSRRKGKVVVSENGKSKEFSENEWEQKMSSYNRTFRKIITSDGIQINGISEHGVGGMEMRDRKPMHVKEALISGKIEKNRWYPSERRDYVSNMTVVVVGIKDGNIITVEDIGRR